MKSRMPTMPESRVSFFIKAEGCVRLRRARQRKSVMTAASRRFVPRAQTSLLSGVKLKVVITFSLKSVRESAA
jgi:hypothetical protein